MGAIDKFLNYMKLNGDADDYDADDDYFDEEDEEDIKPSVKKTAEEPEFEEPQRRVQPKITPIRQNSKKLPGSGMEVCVIKPQSVDESREITETLLANRTVVLNLEGLQLDIAQRIIDFTSGSCYAIGGNLQKISNSIFIVTPASVDISGDIQGLFDGSFDTLEH